MKLLKRSVLTTREGLTERAEASLGRERILWETRYQVLQTQVAYAKDKAGSLARML